MASTQDLLKQLSSMGANYRPPDISSSMDFSFNPIAYKPINMTRANYTQADFGSLKKKDKKKGGFDAPNLWDVLSGTFGQAGGLVTRGGYNVLEDLQNFDKDNPLKSTLEILKNGNLAYALGDAIEDGAKQQWKNWTDGDWSWGDIPGVGFLHGADKGHKRGSDILGKLGVENRWGKIGGGLAIDIAFDPLTYMTGGASTAAKLSKAKEVEKIAEATRALEKTGVKVTGKFKNANEFTESVRTSLKTKYPSLSDSVIDKKVARINTDITNARNKIYNDNINKYGVSVPFSNKYTAAVGDIGKRNLTYRSEAKLGAEFKHVADNLLKENKVSNDLIKKLFNKTDTADLTKTEFDTLTNVLQKASVAFKGQKLRNLPDADIFEVSRLEDLNPNLLGKRRVEKVIRDVDVKVGNKNLGKKNIEDFIEPEVAMNNAKTKLEHFLDGKNPFDARTLKTGNQFINSMADHIADANSQRVGENAKYTRGLEKVQQYVNKNKLSPDEMKQAIYVLEKHAPDSLGGENFVPSARVQGLADTIRPLLDELGSDDVAGGVLSKLRENYFPHVMNHSDETMKKIEEFVKRHPELNSLNKNNKFDKSRKSFQTLAQRDNYIAKLEKAIQKETDPDTIELLREQLDNVAELFDTDVVSALTRRTREGVRARSMKAMQGELQKFGMMVSNPDDISKAKGLKKLDPDEAKKLGLGKGEHYMHPDVLDGMKRIDEIFTDKGMNKAVRALSAVADIWRPLVTYYKPSHYRNNIIGNAIINMAAGVKATDYKVAGKLIHGFRSGKLTDDQMKIMNLAHKHNVISGGFLFDSKPNFQFDDPTKLEKFAEMVGQNKGIKWVRGKGEVADDVMRLANFISGMNKYGNTNKAAQQVRKYLFNYNELTNADRAMRVAVPFWNWMKRNIPLQMNMLLENPKVAMNFERFTQLFNDEEKGEEWQKEMGIKNPWSDHYTSIPSPTRDLNTLLDPKSLLGSMSPVPKIAIETGMNKEFFTGNPISYGEDSVQPADLPRYLAGQTGVGKNIYDMIGSMINGTEDGEKSIPEQLLHLFNPIYKIKEE